MALEAHARAGDASLFGPRPSAIAEPAVAGSDRAYAGVAQTPQILSLGSRSRLTDLRLTRPESRSPPSPCLPSRSSRLPARLRLRRLPKRRRPCLRRSRKPRRSSTGQPGSLMLAFGSSSSPAASQLCCASAAWPRPTLTSQIGARPHGPVDGDAQDHLRPRQRPVRLDPERLRPHLDRLPAVDRIVRKRLCAVTSPCPR